MLGSLLARELSCAPHVLARLSAELGGDAVAICETVAALGIAERRGMRPLPAALPLAPSISTRYAGLTLTPRDLELLLAAVLCLQGVIDPLVEFDGRSPEQISSGEVGAHLELHAGRVAFSDPRLAVWIRAQAGVAAEAAVHERLSAVFRGRGDHVSADWHTARAALRQRPDAAPELIRIARTLSEAGHSDRALLIAGEAAAHATGAERDDARLLAGVSAIASGYAEEAAEWLGGLFSDGLERYRLQGLSGLVVAQAHLRGAVPDVDPMSFRPRTRDPDDWYSWARAAAFAAVLCAERGDRHAMRSWADALRAATAEVGAERELRDPVIALACLVIGDRDVDDVRGTGPLTGEVLGALSAAADGDIDRGLRLLHAGAAGLGERSDPFVAGFEHSPLAHAYRAVTETLLLCWRGDVWAARDRLRAASLALPVALPFAGLGVVLARRLDLVVCGRVTPLASALTASLPRPSDIDRHVDRGIQAYLSGDLDEAASCLRLWRERGSRGNPLAGSGLEEIAAPEEGDAPAHGAEPPEVVLARRLRSRIAATTDAGWRTDSGAIAESALSIASPFARARAEAMIGARFAIRDRPAEAVAHLRTAERLFEESGARACAAAVASRIDRLTSDTDAGAVRDPLAVCRTLWAPILTARELDVAMLAAGGASNRDIGGALRVSVRTVEVHLGRAFAKLDVRTRVELTVLAHRTARRR